jgi:hypothetical protein
MRPRKEVQDERCYDGTMTTQSPFIFARCTLDLVARKYYWPGMLRHVKAYTKACLMCQRICPAHH